MYKHMLVATDGSKLSGKAVAQAIELAQALSAKLTAFYASPDMPAPVYTDGIAYGSVAREEYAEWRRGRQRRSFRQSRPRRSRVASNARRCT